MRLLLPTALIALLLAAPVASGESPEQLALGQERAYMKATPPAAADRALAQERMYMHETTAAVTSARPPRGSADDTAMAIAIAVTAGMLVAGVGTAARRRRVRSRALAGAGPANRGV